MAKVKHADDEPVMFGYSARRNVTMCSEDGGEESGYTWGEWRKMSESKQDLALQEYRDAQLEVWIENDED